MADEVKIVIKAVDQATSNLKSVYGSLKDLHRGVDDFIAAIKDANPRNKEFADRLKEITRAYDNFEINGEEATAQLRELKAEMQAAGQEAEDFDRELRDGSESFHMSLTDIKSGIDMAIGAMREIYQAGKQVWDWAKESAQLDYTADKFDRLASSIGTVSSELMGRLRTATRGMVDDASLMENAGNIMSLGLAKTSDQVVRLTRVAGSLNMDMNQLVLTLANQTTMRFDQLGVSIDGFDERLNKLKSSGKGVNDAFTEAFLQQAEDQVNKLGEAADSAIAPFQRIEVTLKNIKDLVSIELSPMTVEFAKAIDSVISGIKGWDTGMDGLRDTIARFTGYATVFQLLTKGIIGLREAEWMITQLDDPLKDTSEVLKQITAFEKKYEDQAKAAAAASAEAANQTAGFSTELLGFSDAAEGSAQATQDFYDQLFGLKKPMSDAEYQISHTGAATADLSKSLIANGDAINEAARRATALRNGFNELHKVEDQLKDANDRVEKAQKDWAKTVGGDVANALKDAGLNAKNYYTALGLIDQVMGTNFQRQEDYRKAIEDLVKSYDPKNPEAFKEGLDKLRISFEDLSEPLQAALEQIDDLTWKLNNLKNMKFTTTLEIDAYINESGGGGGSNPNPRPPKSSSDYPEPYDLTPELPNTTAPYNTTYSPVLLQTRPNETVTTAQIAPAPSPVTLGPNYFTNDIEIEVLARQVAQYMTRNR